MNTNQREKLKTLIAYWIHHNEEHALEFRDWIKVVKTSGDTKISLALEKAAVQMAKVNEPLSQILTILEGA